MKLRVCVLLFCAILCVTATKYRQDKADEALERPSVNEALANGLEILLKKLEFIDHKLLELQFEVLVHREQIANIQTTHEKTSANLLWSIHRLEERIEKDVGRNLKVLRDQSVLILKQQTTCANLEQIRGKLFNFTPKVNSGLIDPLDDTRISSVSFYKSLLTDSVTPTTTFSSCKNVPSKVSGVYLISVNNISAPFTVFCEQVQYGGGWIVVQHRFNGSVDFNRNWSEYSAGFGNLEREFWLGLDKIHQITKTRPHEIIFEIKDFNGNYGYARYDLFKVGSEREQFRLTLGSYSGTIKDSMEENNGMKFSTKNRDNDQYVGNCAEAYEAAWWYNKCGAANLNGPYKDVVAQKSMFWYHFKNNYRGLSFSGS